MYFLKKPRNITAWPLDIREEHCLFWLPVSTQWRS